MPVQWQARGYQPPNQPPKTPDRRFPQPETTAPIGAQVWGAVAVDDTLALWRPSPAHPWEEVLFAPPAHRAMHRALLDKGGAAGGAAGWEWRQSNTGISNHTLALSPIKHGHLPIENGHFQSNTDARTAAHCSTRAAPRAAKLVEGWIANLLRGRLAMARPGVPAGTRRPCAVRSGLRPCRLDASGGPRSPFSVSLKMRSYALSTTPETQLSNARALPHQTRALFTTGGGGVLVDGKMLGGVGVGQLVGSGTKHGHF